MEVKYSVFQHIMFASNTQNGSYKQNWTIVNKSTCYVLWLPVLKMWYFWEKQLSVQGILVILMSSLFWEKKLAIGILNFCVWIEPSKFPDLSVSRSLHLNCKHISRPIFWIIGPHVQIPVSHFKCSRIIPV